MQWDDDEWWMKPSIWVIDDMGLSTNLRKFGFIVGDEVREELRSALTRRVGRGEVRLSLLHYIDPRPLDIKHVFALGACLYIDPEFIAFHFTNWRVSTNQRSDRPVRPNDFSSTAHSCISNLMIILTLR